MERNEFLETFFTLSREDSLPGHMFIEKIEKGEQDCPETVYALLNLDKADNLYKFFSKRARVDRDSFMANFKTMPVQLFKSALKMITSSLPTALYDSYGNWDSVFIKFGLIEPPVEKIDESFSLSESNPSSLHSSMQDIESSNHFLESLDRELSISLEEEIDLNISLKESYESEPKETSSEQAELFIENESIPVAVSEEQSLLSGSVLEPEDPVVPDDKLPNVPSEEETPSKQEVQQYSIPSSDTISDKIVTQISDVPSLLVPSRSSSHQTASDPNKQIESVIISLCNDAQFTKDQFQSLIYYLTGRTPMPASQILSDEDFEMFITIIKDVPATKVKSSLIKTLNLFWRFNHTETVSRLVNELSDYLIPGGDK